MLQPVFDPAQACGLGVARHLRSMSGPYVVEGWTCEPFCTGRLANPARISAEMAAFHLGTKDTPQRPCFACSLDLRAKATGSDKHLGVMPGSLVTRLRAAWAAMPHRPHYVVHAGLSPSNLIADRFGKIALIDRDETRRDHPGFDPVGPAIARARLAWHIACCRQIEPERARSLAAILTD